MGIGWKKDGGYGHEIHKKKTKTDTSDNLKKHYIYVSTIFVLWSCQGNKPGSQVLNSPYNPQKVVVLENLKHPWSICFLSESQALVTEKDGGLLKVNLQLADKTTIKGFPADLADSIRIKDRRDNSGIFDVISHPDFNSNNLIYLSYAAQSEQGTTTKIVRAELLEDSLHNLETIFLAEPFTSDLFHYGGGMTFGFDGKLYFTIGERLYDEGDQPPMPIAQDLSDRRGKVYRLNDDGSIPADNPDFGPGAIPGIYAIGIRAAQGITLNHKDSTLWFSEHGSTQGDELNLLKPGANYGWPLATTGKYRNATYQPPELPDLNLTEPQHYWLQTIAPTGLTFYNGSEFPDWHGDLFLSGLSRGSLWRIRLANNTVVSLEELFVNDRVRSRKVALSPDGKLFILTDEPSGKLIEIVNGTM